MSLLDLVKLADAKSTVQGGINSACQGGGCGGSNLQVIVGNITNALIFIVGAVSVIMIIIGGLRYVISQGDPKSIESARNTILYAVIGVVVAVAAYAIVNFVVGRF